MAPTFRAKTRKITATLPNVAKVKFLSDAAHALMAASVPELAGYLGRQVLQVLDFSERNWLVSSCFEGRLILTFALDLWARYLLQSKYTPPPTC